MATHQCQFRLEETSKGYLTGKLLCATCGMKVSLLERLDSIRFGPGVIEHKQPQPR